MSESEPVPPLNCPAFIADTFAYGHPSPNPGKIVEFVFSRFDFASIGATSPWLHRKASTRPEATIRMPLAVAFDLAITVLKMVDKLPPEEREAMGLPKELKLEVSDGGTD